MQVTNKKQMYSLLAGGAFGNTCAQFFSVADWKNDPSSSIYQKWGVRTLVPGGPCRLFCPTDEVEETANSQKFKDVGINISLMIDAVCDVTLWADVYDSDIGLIVYGIENPSKGGSWRAMMPIQGKTWSGLAAH